MLFLVKHARNNNLSIFKIAKCLTLDEVGFLLSTKRIKPHLTYFLPMFPFNSRKGFLVFSGSIKWEH